MDICDKGICNIKFCHLLFLSSYKFRTVFNIIILPWQHDVYVGFPLVYQLLLLQPCLGGMEYILLRISPFWKWMDINVYTNREHYLIIQQAFIFLYASLALSLHRYFWKSVWPNMLICPQHANRTEIGSSITLHITYVFHSTLSNSVSVLILAAKSAPLPTCCQKAGVLVISCLLTVVRLLI